MYAGKGDSFDAVAVHLDEVETLAPDTTVLALNAMAGVQAAEIRRNGTVAWGVQYHPEYSLQELAAIVRRTGIRLVEEGFFAAEGDLLHYAARADGARTASRATSRSPGATASTARCSTAACASRKSPTGSSAWCCRRAPSAGAE